LDDRFTKTSTKLLLCVACLNPSDFFSAFKKEKLIRLAFFYRNKFAIIDLMVLGDQLDAYIIDLRSDDEFSNIEGIANLVEKMIKTKKNLIFLLVYMLIKLSLLLPTATTIVERVFFLLCILSRVDCGREWEISGWIVVWLYTLRKISSIRLIMNSL